MNDRYEVLALEWLKCQDNSGLSPVEFLEKLKKAATEMQHYEHPEKKPQRINY